MITQIRQLGQGWSMHVNFGKRITYGLKLNGHHIKTFWSETALHTWVKDLGVDLTNKEGN